MFYYRPRSGCCLDKIYFIISCYMCMHGWHPRHTVTSGVLSDKAFSGHVTRIMRKYYSLTTNIRMKLHYFCAVFIVFITTLHRLWKKCALQNAKMLYDYPIRALNNTCKHKNIRVNNIPRTLFWSKYIFGVHD